MMARLDPNDSHTDPSNPRPVSQLAVRLFVWSAIVAAALLNINRSIRADDVWSFQTALLPLPELLKAVRADVHPPLYFLLLHPWVHWLGPNELAGRLLSVLFHLAATLVVYALGLRLAAAQPQAHRSVPGDRRADAPVLAGSPDPASPASQSGQRDQVSAVMPGRTSSGSAREDDAVRGSQRWLTRSSFALLCSAIYALAPLAVLSAELIRMYSLAGLLSAAAIWFWLVAATGEARTRHWIGLVLVIALGSFTHIWMLCLTCGLAVAAVVHFRPLSRKLLAAIAAALLPFTFVWLPVLAAQVSNSGESAAWLKPPSFQTLGEMVFLHCGVVLLFLFLFLLPQFRRRAPLAAVPAWTVTLYAATLLPPLLISFWKPFFFARFTIVALPALAIVLGCLLSRIRPAPLAVSISALALVFFVGSKASSPKCDARCAAEALNGQAAAGDAIVFGSLSRPPVDYYLQRSFNRERGERILHKQSFPLAIDAHPGYEGAHLRAVDLSPLRNEARAAVDSFVQNGIRRVYFLAGYRRHIDALFIDALKPHFRPLPSLLKCDRGDYFTEILVFERPAGEPVP